MKPYTECRIFNYLSLASSPKQTVSDEEFSSSYTEYEQYLYDLAIESVSVSERLRHLLHSKVELISLKKLFTRTGHFHTAVAEFYLDKCLLLVEAEIELVNFGVQYPGTITTPSSFLSSLHWKGSLVNLKITVHFLIIGKTLTHMVQHFFCKFLCMLVGKIRTQPVGI